jgi:hypothetical protein
MFATAAPAAPVVRINTHRGTCQHCQARVVIGAGPDGATATVSTATPATHARMLPEISGVMWECPACDRWSV